MIALWRHRRWAWPLWPASRLFGWLVKGRRRAFDSGRKSAFRPQAWTISVGNVTVGGTGKTPAVIALAQALSDRDHAVAVVSRGYGRQSKGLLVVSDGRGKIASVRDSGDEPALMARRLPGVPVIVGSDRSEAARLAVARFGATHLVLDDAFQHLRIHRDADLIVMDATRPWGNGFMLPAGPLRDGLDELRRARALLLSRSDQVQDPPGLVQSLKKWTDAPVFEGRHAPSAWVGVDWTPRPLEVVAGKRVWAFSGIGHPKAFHRTLEAAGVTVLGHTAFGDHHWIRPQEWTRLARDAQHAGAQALVCTEKDLVRLDSLALGARDADPPVLALRIDLGVTPDLSVLLNKLLAKGETS